MMGQPDVNMVSTIQPTSEYENRLLEIRLRIFRLLLPSLMITGCIWIIVLNAVEGVPSTIAMMIWFLLECSLIFSYAVYRRSFRLAAIGFFTGTTLCIVIAIQAWNLATFSVLFSFLVLMAVFLLSRAETVVLALATSYLTLQLGDSGITNSLLPFGFIWLALITGFIVSSGIAHIVSMLEHYQQYIWQQMTEARDGRSILAQRTKALDEASQNLIYINSQLRQARRAAEEARRLKAQFAANVSHELRTPINLIVGFTEMIVNAPDTYPVALPSAYWKDINIIYRNARHLQTLINDVLDVSQIEAGQMVVLKEEISLQRVIMEAADMLRDQITRKGLMFETDIPHSLPRLLLDPVRIRQIIINLLSNALRFTDQGFIRIAASLDAEKVTICIADSGIGIPAQEMEQIFEEFHQLDNSLSRRFGGSGLGLTLSRHFIALHHGRIWAKSEGIPGRGSQFYIELPLTDDPIQLINPHSSARVERQPERCYVVLDDDPAVIQLFERYSQRHQAVGSVFSNETIEWLKRIQPSALVMDTQAASALEAGLLQEIRQVAPVITCLMPSGRRAMQQFGIADYLVKPVTAAELQRVLRQVKSPIKSILIVDDDPEIVRLFDRMLQTTPEHYQIRKAYGGLEGLALMRSQRPDAVILDLLMPDLDGLTFVQHIKLSPELADVPVIMVSARGASEAVSPRMSGVLTVHKPTGFQPLELVKCVEALVDHFTPASDPG